VRYEHLLTAAAIQLFVFFLPLGAGITGLLSGGLAGLTAVLGWFVLGIPLSYAAIDALAVRHSRAQEQGIAATPVPGIPTATIS
jgi:hypothetical protein